MFYIPRVSALALGALLAPAADDAAVHDAAVEPPDDTIVAEAVFVGTVHDVWEACGRAIARFVVECAGLGTRVGEIVGVTVGLTGGQTPAMGTGQRWMIVTTRIHGR